MAGRVRQKIDQASLEAFLQENVPEIVTPVQLKQVGQFATPKRCQRFCIDYSLLYSSVLANPTQHIKLSLPLARSLFFASDLLASKSPSCRIVSNANTKSLPLSRTPMCRYQSHM